MKKAPKKCRWCKAFTDRRCGICLPCCDARDEYDRKIDAGLAPYIPPEEIPGHRFYKRKHERSIKQIESTRRLNANILEKI